jgi:hypothetical protein
MSIRSSRMELGNVSHLGDIYEHSNRLTRFLGGWHTHPNGYPYPSKRDVRTAAAVAGAPSTRLPNPITLTFGVEELSIEAASPSQLRVTFTPTVAT